MASVNESFKFTQNQLNEVDMGLCVTTVSDPNRVVITNVSGYLQVSDITYSQLQELVSGSGDVASIHNQDSEVQEADFKINGAGAFVGLSGNSANINSDEISVFDADESVRVLKSGVVYGRDGFYMAIGGETLTDIRTILYPNKSGTIALTSDVPDAILNQTASAQSASFRINGTGQLQGGGEVLKIGTNTGNADHAYVGFYARTATPTVRTATVGYSTVGTTICNFVTEASGHQISIRTSSAGNIGITAAGGSALQVQAYTIQQSSSGSISNWSNILGLNLSNSENSLYIETSLDSVANGSIIRLKNFKGTSASRTAMLTGNSIGLINFEGQFGTISGDIYTSSSLRSLTTENWTSIARGSKIDIYTTPNTTITQKLALTVDQDSSVRTWSGGESLKVGTNTGNADHAYMGLYARTATPSVRSAIIGYEAAGGTALTLRNSLTNGDINLFTTGSSAAVNVNTGTYLRVGNFIGVTGWDNYIGTSIVGLPDANGASFVSHLSQISAGSKIALRSSSGTQSSPSPTLSGNSLGQYILGGHITSVMYDAISIRGLATENWSSTAGGSKVEIYTTPNTTITQKLALTIDQDSSVRTWGGGESLKVGTNTGNADHAYMGFYARTATPTTRSGTIGYRTIGGGNLTIFNEVTGNPIELTTTGSNTSVNAVARSIQLSPVSADTTSNWTAYLGRVESNHNALILNTGLGSNSQGSKVILRTSGTTLNQLTLINNTLGQYVFGGFGIIANNYDSVSIRGLATENWSSTAGGSKIDIYTTPNGTTTQALAVTIDQDQSLLYKYASKSVDPTATEIPDGCVKVYLNTTSGVLKMWANQAGVLKSTTLA